MDHQMGRDFFHMLVCTGSMVIDHMVFMAMGHHMIIDHHIVHHIGCTKKP